MPLTEGIMNIKIRRFISIEDGRKVVLQIILTITITAVKDSSGQHDLCLWHDPQWDFVGISGDNS